MAAKFKRRTFMVRKKFQYVYILSAVIFSNISTLAFLIFARMFFAQSRTLMGRIDGPEAEIISDFIAISEMNFELYFTGVFFFTTLLTIVGGVFISHRAAGPLFEFNRYLTSIYEEKGEIRDLRFRQGDFFHDLKESFNKYQKYIIENSKKLSIKNKDE